MLLHFHTPKSYFWTIYFKCLTWPLKSQYCLCFWLLCFWVCWHVKSWYCNYYNYYITDSVLNIEHTTIFFLCYLCTCSLSLWGTQFQVQKSFRYLLLFSFASLQANDVRPSHFFIIFRLYCIQVHQEKYTPKNSSRISQANYPPQLWNLYNYIQNTVLILTSVVIRTGYRLGSSHLWGWKIGMPQYMHVMKEHLQVDKLKCLWKVFWRTGQTTPRIATSQILTYTFCKTEHMNFTNSVIPWTYSYLLHMVESNHINKPHGFRPWMHICCYMTLHQITEPMMIFKFCSQSEMLSSLF